MNTGEKGAYSELVACAWLLTQVYEVFRNVCPTGPTDIVAIKDGVVERFDVKTLHPTQTSANIELTDEQQEVGVKVLGVCSDGSCRVLTSVPMVRIGECEECGKTHQRRRRKQRYCSDRCAHIHRTKKLGLTPAEWLQQYRARRREGASP
jgi:hypothetical protein